MSFFVFLLVGIVGAWVTTELNSEMRHHFFHNAILGVIGSLIGGYSFEILGVTIFNFWEQIGTAMVGTTLVLFAVKLICRPDSVGPIRTRG